MAELQRRLDRLEAQNEALKEKIESLEHSSAVIDLADIPSPTKRSVFNRIIRDQASESGRSFSEAVRDYYVEVYNDFLSVYGVNLRVRARNRDLAVVEYAESADFIDALLSLAAWKFELSAGELRALFEDELPAGLELAALRPRVD